MLRIICSLGIAAFGVCGCVQKVNQSTDRVTAGAPLVIVEGANEVRYTSEHDGAVEYWNVDAYPAGVTIERLDQLLFAAEWRPTNEDILSENPNDDLRKWGTTYEPSGDGVHQWLGAWKNEKGHFVTFALRYRVPKGKPIPARLEILGVHMTSERVQRMRQAAQKIPRLN